MTFCSVCGQPAINNGPYAEKPMCQEHYDFDVVYVQSLCSKLDEKLNPYSEKVKAFEDHQLRLKQELQEIKNQFGGLSQQINNWKTRMTAQVTAQQQAAQKYIDDCADIVNYKREVQTACAERNWLKLRDLEREMKASLPDLEADLRNAAKQTAVNSSENIARLQKLKRVVDDCIADTLLGPWETASSIKCVSHEVKTDGLMINWVTVCDDSAGYSSDPTGRVIRMPLSLTNCSTLPQPCLIAASVKGNDHLIVLSLDGRVNLRIHCGGIVWENYIWGLHCDKQLIFIAQEAVVTVVDLCGTTLKQIHPGIAGLDSFKGIGGNAASLFVTGANKIATFNKITRAHERTIVLENFPDATLYNLAVHESFILVIDRKHARVHRINIDSHQLVASYPTAVSTGLEMFDWPRDLSVDDRGRLFVSECAGHSVRALSARDGSLLWTLGEPGQAGSSLTSLYGPSGLAVVPAGSGNTCDQLVVSDCWNKRLLVLNLH